MSQEVTREISSAGIACCIAVNQTALKNVPVMPSIRAVRRISHSVAWAPSSTSVSGAPNRLMMNAALSG